MLQLRQLLAPLDLQTFFSDYLGTRFLHTLHPSDMVGQLTDLELVSEAISRLRYSGGRLRLTKGGQIVDAGQYSDYFQAPKGARVNVQRVMRELRTGATLVLDHVDELLPPVERIARNFEAELRLPVNVNLYMGWGDEPGFALHWDEHDVFILQTMGRKHWTVYEPTQLHPIREGSLTSPMSPDAQPVFDQELVPGSLLYLPRGWWHVARAVETPCAHLTFGVFSHTGLDFLKWTREKLVGALVARQDVPIHADAAARQAWLNELADAVGHILRSPDILDEYEEGQFKPVMARPHLQLADLRAEGARRGEPVVATEELPSRAVSVLLLEPMRISAGNEDEQITVTCGQVVWHCTDALSGPLQHLSEDRQTPLRDVSEALAPSDAAELRLLVEALAACGVARLEAA